MIWKILIILVWWMPLSAWSYPEMVRHGYIHCTACHTTLVGGGLLNEYGRSLSREILSQPSFLGKPSAEGDEQFAGGGFRAPEWLLLGGDVRLLQTFVESPQGSRGRFMVMQVDVDASAQVNDWFRVFFSVGRIEPRVENAQLKDFIASPRHGVEFRLTPADQESRVAVRLGRFMPAYGIPFAEHTFASRRLLDFGPGQERYGAEFAWSNDTTSVIGTGIAAQANGNGNKVETGGAVQVARAIGSSSKVGANFYKTKRDDTGTPYDRQIDGIFAYIGFNKQWYGLLEVDRPKDPNGLEGFIDVFKLGYEMGQGLHFFGVHEFANLNVAQAHPKFEALGLGAQWFPRPHWDLYGTYRKERNTALSNDFQDVIWLIAHFYL